MAEPDLCIVIVSHNTEALLDECLRSLETGGARPGTDIVVVDNASTDGTRTMVAERHPAVRHTANERNLGFAAANNRGLAGTSGRYALFLNPDTVVPVGTLDAMVEFMDSHPDAGASTCFVALPDGTLDDAAHRGFPTPWNALCHFSGLSRLRPRSRLFGGYNQGWKDMDVPHQIDALCGCFMLVRRAAGEPVGWWDEEYTFYGDDLDFCWRLRRAGWAVYFVPQVSILHYKGTSAGIRPESRARTTASLETRLWATRHRFEAMRIFYRKHLMSRYPRVVSAVVLTGIGLMEWAASLAIRRRAGRDDASSEAR